MFDFGGKCQFKSVLNLHGAFLHMCSCVLVKHHVFLSKNSQYPSFLPGAFTIHWRVDMTIKPRIQFGSQVWDGRLIRKRLKNRFFFQLSLSSSFVLVVLSQERITKQAVLFNFILINGNLKICSNVFLDSNRIKELHSSCGGQEWSQTCLTPTLSANNLFGSIDF